MAGASTTFTLTGDEGGRATFHFCPRCGATVYYQAEAAPEWIAIPAKAGTHYSSGFTAPFA